MSIFAHCCGRMAVPVVTLLYFTRAVYGAAPVISDVPDQSASPSTMYSYTPDLDGSGGPDGVNWTKTFGPDGVNVNAATGTVIWNIPDDLPGESFYIGVKAANADGCDIESWIVNVGVPKVVYIGPGEPHTTLVDAFDKNRLAGTSFIVRNGTYSGSDYTIARLPDGSTQYPVMGTPANFTTVMAEDPGGVTFTDGAIINISGIYGAWGYAAFKGIFLKGGVVNTYGIREIDGCSATGGCRPHHIKFMYNGVESDGETPFLAFRSDDILFENNYAFGGGRYKFSCYQADRIVFRRNVARYDRSNNEMAEPKGTYSIYTSLDVVVANNIAVDADKPEFITLGQLAGEYTCPTTSGYTTAKLHRNIQLNSDMLYGNMDNQSYGPCDAEVDNIVSWDVRPVNSYVMSRGGTWFDHVTMGNVRQIGGYQTAVFNGWPSDYVRGMTNSVVHNITNGDLFWGFKAESDVLLNGRTVDRYGVDHVNITGSPGKLDAAESTIGAIFGHDPIYSEDNVSGGLRYLVRIEPHSALSGKAADGSDLGANVLTFRGVSGTFWGEEGYDDETGIPMWPFPLEGVIKEKMAAYSFTGNTYSGDPLSRTVSGTGTINGTRGFAVAGQSLTNYVWGYLGNTVPPFNVHAVPASGRVTIRWDPPVDVSNITGYTIYDYDMDERTMSNPRSVPAGVYGYTIGGLTDGHTYGFVVTAVDSIKGESSYSYSVQAVPLDTTAMGIHARYDMPSPSSFTVFPNPSSGYIGIAGPEKEYMVYDNRGRLVETVESFAYLDGGVYLVANAAQTAVQRVVVLD